MTKIFVGNFPFSVDDEKLKEFFSRVGAVVSAKVMKEGDGGRSRGFGFVEMSSADDAQRAISELEGTLWEGRQIRVSEDRGHRRKPEGGHSGPHHHQGGDRDRDREPRQYDGGERSQGGQGYFRAQPLETVFRRRKKLDPFIEDPTLALDYKDARLLRRFLSERGKILPRRMTGLTAYNQRQVARAIKRAQHIAIISPTEG